MISSLCLSMIFSENRFPLFRIMLWIARRRRCQSADDFVAGEKLRDLDRRRLRRVRTMHRILAARFAVQLADLAIGPLAAIGRATPVPLLSPPLLSFTNLPT